jgi:hypothetical protein
VQATGHRLAGDAQERGGRGDVSARLEIGAKGVAECLAAVPGAAERATSS